MRRISNKLYNDIREIEANTSEVWPKSIIVIRLTRMYKIKRLFICRFQ
jgi:hypothetical protein